MVFGKKVATVEVTGHLGSAECQGGRGEVKARDEVTADGSGFQGGMGPGNKAGNMDASFVTELLVTKGLVVSVVGKEEDDGVFEFSVGLEFFEDVFNLFVRSARGVVVKGPGLLQARSLREIRRKFDGIVGELVSFSDMLVPGLASPKHDLAKPRLVFIGARAPGSFGEGADFFGLVSLPAVHPDFVFRVRTHLVELATIVVEIVVIFPAVESEVAGITHQLGDGLHPLRKMNADFLGNDAELAG